MAKRVFKADLSVSGINNLIKQIEDYQRGLQGKCVTFCERLIEEGITIANANATSSLVVFGKDVNPTQYGCNAIFFGKDIDGIVQRWVVSGGEIREEEISPLLMAEFGSGRYAKTSQWDNGYGAQGLGGQGTLNKYGHAFDEDGWYWRTEDGVLHHSYGTEPTMPMYKAWLEMYKQIDKIAKEVFGA